MTLDEVKAMAREAEKHKQALDAMGLRNCAGMTAEQRVETAVDWRIAQALWKSAEDDYQAALNAYMEGNKP